MRIYLWNNGYDVSFLNKNILRYNNEYKIYIVLLDILVMLIIFKANISTYFYLIYNYTHVYALVYTYVKLHIDYKFSYEYE